MTALYQARYAARQAAAPEAWRAKLREKKRLQRLRHPEKKAAWNAVYRAIKSGQLVRPDRCEHCNVECVPDASHDDYTQRLTVEWLCRSCHAAKDAATARAIRKGA